MKKVFLYSVIGTCVVFTVMMTISLIVAYCTIGPNDGLNLALSLLIASVATAVLQGVWFSGAFIKKMRYAFRMLGFAIMLLPSLFACGWFGGWFPQRLEAAGLFAVIFFVLLAVITIGYGIYFKKTVGSYEQAMKKYREAQELKRTKSSTTEKN